MFGFFQSKQEMSLDKISYEMAFQTLPSFARNLKKEIQIGNSNAMNNLIFDEGLGDILYKSLCEVYSLKVKNEYLGLFKTEIYQHIDGAYLVMEHPSPQSSGKPYFSAIYLEGKLHPKFSTFVLCYSPTRDSKSNIRFINSHENAEMMNMNYGIGCSLISPAAFSKSIDVIGHKISDINILFDRMKQFDDDAEYLLAECAHIGLFMRRDDDMAMGLYQMLADRGYSLAQCTVGKLFDAGVLHDSKNPNSNNTLAKQYLQEAIKKGVSEAKYHLGIMYLMEDKIEEGFKLLQLASQEGYYPAKKILIKYRQKR